MISSSFNQEMYLNWFPKLLPGLTAPVFVKSPPVQSFQKSHRCASPDWMDTSDVNLWPRAKIKGNGPGLVHTTADWPRVWADESDVTCSQSQSSKAGGLPTLPQGCQISAKVYKIMDWSASFSQRLQTRTELQPFCKLVKSVYIFINFWIKIELPLVNGKKQLFL